MSFRQRIASLAAIAIVASTVGGFAATGPALASSAARATSAPAAATGSFACALQQFCDYIYDNGTGACFKANPFSGIPSDNWSYYGCRNVDGSIYNNTVFTFRVFYGPNHGDPHACVPPYTKVSDLFNYDIASFSFSTSPCTNTPL
jgi:hypothetical protein